MRSGRACRLLTISGRACACLGDATRPYLLAAVPKDLLASHGPAVRMMENNGTGHAGPATAPAGWAALLLGIAAAAAPGACCADAPNRQAPSSPLTSAAAAAAAAAGPGGAGGGGGGDGGGGGAPPPALTNHPLEYDPVTNEHTAKMTMARTAALDYYNAGKYAQAEAKFREAVSEAQLGFESGDPHIASAKNNLAEFLRNTGRWAEAEQLYKEALDLLERNFGEKHWLFVAALHNLALSYEAAGDLATARTTMERVLALRLAMFGPRHFLYADSLFALGHMMRAVPGQRGEAMRMMAEAVRVLEEAEKLQVNVVLLWLTEIANHHTADGRPDLAAAALRRAVAHLGTEHGEEAAAASALAEQLVEALAAAGRPAEAAEAAAEALAARRKMFGEGALVVAQSEMRVAQLQLLAAAQPPSGKTATEAPQRTQPPTQPQQHQQEQPPAATAAAAAAGAAPLSPQPAADGPGPALRALQHAEAAARISAANVDECSRGGLLSGPPADKLVKRLRAAHTLGSAAKLVATLAGVGDPAATAAAATAAPPPPPPPPGIGNAVMGGASSGASPTSPASAAPSRGWSWWPFGGGKGSPPPAAAAAEAEAAAPAQARGPAPPQVPLPPAEPVAELSLADRRLDQAATALMGAVAAGKQLMQAVGSGRRQLPSGVSADELAGLLVEAQLQLLDVLERLGLVLQARVAAGQGGAAAAAGGGGLGGSGDVVERHRRVLEQQERVVAELLA
ncbi:hypothetical protein PLESTB_001352100 [Pleodorina starrii]|uniref:Kinesin light chain n=1 Tax=Pleodorina starrii TaxID=330485 RepID=A0A9W6BUT9_9CHLO|nr:hypothetical protein PLESTB_001352100 [Pleodorina starrii]